MAQPIRRVVNVRILTSPIFPRRAGFGIALILGTSSVLPLAERSRSYRDMDAVAADFPDTSEEYIAANIVFSQSPRPDSLRIGRRFTQALPGELVGTTDVAALDAWTAIENGSVRVIVDGQNRDLTAMDFSEETNLNGVASVIQTKLAAVAAGSTVTYDGTKFVIRSGTAGAASTVARTVAVAPATGTHIGGLMGTDAGTAYAGVAPESVAAALTAQAEYSTEWYGVHFTYPQMEVAADVLAAAAWTESRVKIFGHTPRTDDILSAAVTNDVQSQLKAGNYRRTFSLFDRDDEYAALSAMARAFAVNFNMENSTITLKFKTLPGVTADDTLTSTQVDTLISKNTNYYTYFGDSAMVAEGVMANGVFFDEVHGLDWLQNAIETEVFGFLYTRTTKVPQTNKGVALIVQQAEIALQQGVNNGLLAPGTWNGTEFGDLKVGDYLKRGFYTFAQSVDEQSQSDREARKAPPIQIAAKGAGAIHFVDIDVTFGR